MNSYKTLISQIKAKNYEGATRTFADVMEQKVAIRLGQEKQAIAQGALKEDYDPKDAKRYECKKCGHVYWGVKLERCPDCDKLMEAASCASCGEAPGTVKDEHGNLVCADCADTIVNGPSSVRESFGKKVARKK